MKNEELSKLQIDFIEFLLTTGALKFGEFTLKSGRKAPYFINFGDFNTAQKLSKLGEFYAQTILQLNLKNITSIFGPTYKGIPLAISAAENLSKISGRDYGFTFNRKEAKNHGEAGLIVGTPISNGTEVIIVEDVITAGTTMREIIPLVRELGGIVSAVVIAVDRQEKGSGEISALKEAEKELGIKIFPIVSINSIINYLANSGRIEPSLLENANNYLKQYGAL